MKNPNANSLFLVKAIALGVAAMLSACGGGGGDDSGPSASTGPSTSPTQPSIPSQPLPASFPSLGAPNTARPVPAEEAKPIIENMRAVALAASGSSASLVFNEDTEELLNWAEWQHPEFFPGKQPNQFSAPYDFRFYPLTGNYTGVANGRVYTLGPMNNGALVDHGTVESFACTFKPDRCSAPGMQTSVAAAPYPAGSDRLEVFNLLNKERARCGFGMLNHNAILDKAAENHLEYTRLNISSNGGFSHRQVLGSPGFTGISPSDRAIPLGYGNARSFVGESAASANAINAGVNNRGMAADALKWLLNAPYHALDLMNNYQDVGMGYGLVSEVPYPSGSILNRAYLIANPGRVDYSSSEQNLAADTVRTYPCQGSTDIKRILTGEIPNPVSPRNLATNPIGSSIVIHVKNGNTLLITGASMTNVATGAPIALLPALTKANDPNPGYLQSDSAIIMADKPLEAMTDYKVTISGTNNGVAFQRVFQFQTGKDIMFNRPLGG
jgi:uncharacterized protein YkwD